MTLDNLMNSKSYSSKNNNNDRMWLWIKAPDGQPLPYNILNINFENDIMKIEYDLMTCDLPREKNKIFNFELPIENYNFSLYKNNDFKSVNHYDLYFNKKNILSN